MFTPRTHSLMRAPLNIGEIKNADGIGTAGVKGETTFMKMWLSLKDGVIDDIRFKIYGCLPNAATGSIVTEAARNRSLEEALQIDEAFVLSELGGLPPDKRHCASLAVTCLRNTIRDAQTGISSQSGQV